MPGASRNVPHSKQQFGYSCIRACARMVLAFLGRRQTEAELRTLMRTDPNGTPVRRLTELTHLGFSDVCRTDAPKKIRLSASLAQRPLGWTSALVRRRTRGGLPACDHPPRGYIEK
jgi:hypothetical protein